MTIKYSFTEYNSYTCAVLNFIAAELETVGINKNSKSFTSKTYEGREGAKALETLVKNYINRIPELVSKVNIFVKSDIFILKDIFDPELDAENEEAAKRAWADLFLTVELKDKTEISIPVNIKSTTGKTADNVCGWTAASFILFEDYETASKGNTAVKALQDGKLDKKTVRDYFLWVFYTSPTQPYSGTAVFSLLQLDPDNYTYNASQSFPLQINSKKPGILIDNTPNMSIGDRKVRFALWLVKKQEAYYKKMYESYSATAANIK